MKRIGDLLALTTILVAGAAPLAAQDAAPPADADPFSSKTRANAPAADPAEPPRERRSDVNVTYEVFSLDLATAASLMRADPPDAVLYQTVIRMVADGKARQEHFSVMRTRLGQTSSTHANLEYLYPTEWEPAEIPNTVGIAHDPTKPAEKDPKTGAAPFVTPSTGTAFDYRPLGASHEVETNANQDGSIFEVRFSPEHAVLADTSTWGQGVSELVTPEFEVQRLSTGLMLVPDLPRFVGTINAAPISKRRPVSTERIRFAFLTCSYVK